MKPKITVRGVVFSAIFAALTSVLSFFSIFLGFTPVPITLGNLGPMLAGSLLGAGYGFFSIFLFLALTALGLPLLRGTGGLGVLLGPSGGYLVMWPISALLVGWLVTRVKGSGVAAFIKIFLIIEIFGVFLVYLTGAPWLAYVTNIPLERAFVTGVLPYIIGDTLKAIVTTIIVLPVRRIYPPARLVGAGGANVAILDDQEPLPQRVS